VIFKRSLLPALLLLLLAFSVSGISLIGGNTFEYRNAQKGHGFFENRADIFMFEGGLSAGARIQTMQPSRLDPVTNRDTTYSAIAHRYAQYSTDRFTVTGGTFYETLGRGLLLNLFEDRRMVIDHNLDGARASFNVPYVSGKLFQGKGNWDDDVIIRGGELTLSPPFTQSGICWLDYEHDLAGRTNAWSAYLDIPLSYINLYGEFGEKHPVGGTDGQALYLTGDIAIGRQSLALEYKKYEDFYLRSMTMGYNNPPSAMRENSYTLLSRHVHNQNMAGEEGFIVSHLGSYPLDINSDISFGKVWDVKNDEKAFTETHVDLSRAFGHIDQHLVLNLKDNKYYDSKVTTFYSTEPVSFLWQKSFVGFGISERR
jgi:hypothetical protein